MICRDVVKRIELDFPREFALEWDNTGLLAGRVDKEVNSIFIALDADDEAVEAAIKSGADLLLTHHPLIFTPVGRITDENFVTGRIVKLLRADLSCYAMHTNYDVLRMGYLAGEMLGFQNSQTLMVTSSGEVSEGIGQVADLRQPVSVKEYCAQVKKTFDLDHVRLFGDPEGMVKRVAISPGSGKGMTEVAIKSGADLLITGDIGHHDGIDAVAAGLTVIDAGHYGIEHIFIKDVNKYIEETFPHIKVITAKIKHPFVMI